MEVTAAPSATALKTIAELVPRAASRYADRTAARYKREGEWRDVSYAELDEIVTETGLGLIDLGLEAGERLCILANTRPEWSYADLAGTSAGAVVVPIYQTNSPEECHWVISDSDACAVVCEDALQLAKIAAIRERLPNLRTVVVMDPPTAEQSTPEIEALQAIPLDEVRARGRGRDEQDLQARRAGVRPEDPFTFIYTSGTTGPPKGCVLSHGNYSAIIEMVEGRGTLDSEAGDVVYLYLPLAHSFALLLQLLVFDLGVTLAYFGGDTKQIIGELAEVKPTYLPSVPRVFEKIYTLVCANADPGELAQAVRVGMQVRELQLAGQPIPTELQAPVRTGRGAALQKRARRLRRARARGGQRGGADRQGDPRILLRLWRARDGGLWHD